MKFTSTHFSCFIFSATNEGTSVSYDKYTLDKLVRGVPVFPNLIESAIKIT